MNLKLKYKYNNLLEKYRFETLYSKEPETIFWIKQISNKETLIDIGANIGIFSLFAGKNNIKTYGVEPFKKNFLNFKKNIKLNKLKNVTALNYALSNFNGIAYFYHGGDKRYGSTGGFISKKKISKRDEVVKVITLDALIKKLKIKNNFHIKIDIDKNLMSLLNGFKNSIRNNKLKSVLIEIELNEKKKVYNFFKKHMKLINLEKKIKKHSSVRRRKKKSCVRNILFVKN
jgi:FkbM family methyltransferase